MVVGAKAGEWRGRRGCVEGSRCGVEGEQYVERPWLASARSLRGAIRGGTGHAAWG